MPDSKITIQGGKVLREGGKLNSSSSCNCCDSLECRTTGLHIGCVDDNMLCSARFALCANELEFGIAALDTGLEYIILTRQTEYFYKYEEVGVRKYELRFRNSADNADGFFTRILRVFQWEGSPAAWVQKRSSKDGETGSMYAASIAFHFFPDHGTSFGEIEIATVLHYKMWALDDYHADTVSATVTGVTICKNEGDPFRQIPCRNITIDGVERACQMKSLTVAGPVTLTRNYAPTNSPWLASDCLYQGISGSATFYVYGIPPGCPWDDDPTDDILNQDGLLFEVTFDLIWSAYLTGNGEAVQVSIVVYSSDVDDITGDDIFSGSGLLAELKPRCEGESVDVDSTIVCINEPESVGVDYFVRGGTATIVFPAVGT